MLQFKAPPPPVAPAASAKGNQSTPPPPNVLLLLPLHVRISTSQYIISFPRFASLCVYLLPVHYFFNRIKRAQQVVVALDIVVNRVHERCIAT